MNLINATFLLVASLAVAAKAEQTEDPRDLQARIVGGREAPPDRYPYTVSMQTNGGTHFCGGSLIAPDIVLCAAHCDIRDGERAVVNPYNIQSPLSDAEVFSVVFDETVPHPQYSGSTLDNDFTIIKLNGQSSHPVVTLNQNTNQPSPGSRLDVMGWGVFGSGSGSSPVKLHEVNVEAMTNSDCSNLYGGGITNNMLCALEDTKGSCQGDSGGPLIIQGNNAQGSQDVQVGVVSWGEGCADASKPGVYANVAAKYDWIKAQVCNLSDSPPASFACPGSPVAAPTDPPVASPVAEPTDAPVASPVAEPTDAPVAGPNVEMTQILVEIELDAFPWETSWRIRDIANNLEYSAVPKFTDSEPLSTQQVLVSVPLNDAFKLMLRDDFGDGFDGKLAVYLGNAVDSTKLLAFFDGSKTPYTNLKRINFVAGTSGIISPPAPPQPPTDVDVLVSIALDDFPDETSWVIKDKATKVKVADSNGEYEYSQRWTTVETTVTLPSGTYLFILKDSFGDGLYGTVDLYSDSGASLGAFDGITDFTWFNSQRIEFTV